MFINLDGLIWKQGRVCWCVYWIRLVLVRHAPRLYSASPMKQHAMAMQWCSNPDHFPDSEPASRSRTLMCLVLSRAAANLNVFCLMQLGIDAASSSSYIRRILNHYTTRLHFPSDRRISWHGQERHLTYVCPPSGNPGPSQDIQVQVARNPSLSLGFNAIRGVNTTSDSSVRHCLWPSMPWQWGCQRQCTGIGLKWSPSLIASGLGHLHFSSNSGRHAVLLAMNSKEHTISQAPHNLHLPPQYGPAWFFWTS